MRIHGVVWYFSAKTLLVAALLYYFVGSNIVLWYLAGSAVFYALMATNVRKKPVIFTSKKAVPNTTGFGRRVLVYFRYPMRTRTTPSGLCAHGWTCAEPA